MDLKGILAISGYKGLYKHISEGKNAIIVESLEDKNRMPAYASYRISTLEEISIYTEEEDINLLKIFEKIFEKENGGAAISHKSSSNELKAYFSEILPDYDKERVYVSDIKKVLNWYNILQKLDLIKIEEKKEEETKEENKLKDKKTTEDKKPEEAKKSLAKKPSKKLSKKTEDKKEK
ncbi:DUF5606 domain-containing protein [Bacteroidota bacterium]